jgi:hypothetical protein
MYVSPPPITLALVNALSNLTHFAPHSIMCAVPSVVLDAVYLKATTTSTRTTTTPATIPNAEPFTMHLQSKSSAARARIQTFYETTLALQTRYNNVHPVTEVITKVVDLLDGPNTSNSVSAEGSITPLSASGYGSVYSRGGISMAMRTRHPRACWNWNDLVASQSRYYLGVLRALDLVLSTGRSESMSTPAPAPAPMSIPIFEPALTPVPPLPAVGGSVANTDIDRDQCAEEDMGIGTDADPGTEVDIFAKSPSIAIQPGPNNVVSTPPPLLPEPPQSQPLHVDTEPEPSKKDTDSSTWSWNWSWDCWNENGGPPRSDGTLALADNHERKISTCSDFDTQQMANSRSSDPVLRDIFGLCRDLDVETLLSMV